MSICPSCVVTIHPPEASFNLIRLLVGRTFFNGVPEMQIVVVHPEYAHACVSLFRSNSSVPNSCGLIVACLLCSFNWCPTLVVFHFLLYHCLLWSFIVCCTQSICLIAFHAVALVVIFPRAGSILFLLASSAFAFHNFW